MQGLCHVSLSYLQSWSAPLSPCLEFLHRTRNLGFMKFVVCVEGNFQNCFALKKSKMCYCCSCLCSRHQLWVAPGGVPAQPPSAAFDPWAPLVNAPVLQSSCKVLWLGIHLLLQPGQSVQAWPGGTQKSLWLGSVPCPSLGRRGGSSAAGSKVLRHKVLLKNLNISDYGEAFAFHSF